MRKKISFEHNGKKIDLVAKICVGLERGSGLMFKFRNWASALLFEFNRPVTMALTSLFVFFPFVAIWFDEKNRVLDLQIIKPFKPLIKAKKPFTRLLEIPLSHKYRRVIEKLVGKERFKKI